MGWMIKAVILVVGLFSLTLGIWQVWVPCFGYLAYSVWSSTHRRTVLVRDKRKPEQPPQARSNWFKKRYVLAGFFFVLASLGLAAGGALSPVVFFSIGALILASGLVTGLGPSLSEATAAPDSVVLRSRWLPFSWISLVEVKFGSPQLSRALALIGREVILTAESDNAVVYLPIRVRAFSVPEAERKVSDALAPVARMLGSKGAYVVPLDSKEAAARFDRRLRPVDLALEYGRDGVTSLQSTPFEVLVLGPASHLLESAAAYVTLPVDEKKKAGGRAVIPGKGRKLESQPLLWEALENIGERYLPQSPDGMTNFLSSVCATRGESLGDRLVNGGEGDSEAGTILVGSLGATHVELTRPQLRAIVRTYG